MKTQIINLNYDNDKVYMQVLSPLNKGKLGSQYFIFENTNYNDKLALEIGRKILDSMFEISYKLRE